MLRNFLLLKEYLFRLRQSAFYYISQAVKESSGSWPGRFWSDVRQSTCLHKDWSTYFAENRVQKCVLYEIYFDGAITMEINSLESHLFPTSFIVNKNLVQFSLRIKLGVTIELNEFLKVGHVVHKRKGSFITYVVSKLAIFAPLPPLCHLFTTLNQ